jgi:hypothetical protein
MRVSAQLGRRAKEDGGFLRIEHELLAGVDFSGRRLPTGFRSWESTFTQCRFASMRIGDAGWGGGVAQSEYTECWFDGTTMGMRAPGNCRFVRCSFRDVHIRPLFAYACEFIDCVFTGRLQGGWVSGTPTEPLREAYARGRNTIEGNDFSGADLFDIGFRGGVDLTRNRMPTGPEYLVVLNGPEALRRVKLRVLDMPESGLRKRALIVIGTHEKHSLSDGQEHLFVRRDAASRSMVDAAALVFDTLAEEAAL